MEDNSALKYPWTGEATGLAPMFWGPMSSLNYLDPKSLAASKGMSSPSVVRGQNHLERRLQRRLSPGTEARTCSL